jgi:hypothetical protein
MEISSPKHPSQQNSGNTENTRRIGDPGSKSPTDSSEEAQFKELFVTSILVVDDSDLVLMGNFMDEIDFNEAGNEVTMVKRRESK